MRSSLPRVRRSTITLPSYFFLFFYFYLFLFFFYFFIIFFFFSSFSFSPSSCDDVKGLQAVPQVL